MFQSLRTVVYHVSDLDRARRWYQTWLGREPVHASPFAVVFAAGDSLLTLVRGETGDAPVAYWAVADADDACRRLVEAGAAEHKAVRTSMGQARLGTVTDPFGNVLGVMSVPAAGEKKALDERASETAQGVAMLRALGAADEREEVRGADSLAHLFIDPAFQAGLRDPRTRQFICGRLPGSYEYMLARTAFFDGLVRQTLEANVPQVVFLGAGYDTRAVRFRHLMRDTVVIELDAAPTQQRKRQLLPDSPARYAPIDFQKDSMAAVLVQAGYEPGARTLFVWEGVTPYLTREAVESTLAFIRTQSGPRSELAFDYVADAPDLMDRYGVKESAAAIRSALTRETVQFRIPEGTAAEFLAARGFDLVEHLNTEQLERRYLALRDGTLAGRAMAAMCLARAVTI